MNMKTIDISKPFIGEDKQFINTYKGKLPIGYINKSVCGCGATSMVINNQYDSIIAVPTLELIRNKVLKNNTSVAKHPNTYELMGIYSYTSKQDIIDYINKQEAKNEPFKIMVTFDSLHKAVEFIKPDTQLIIDEVDYALTSWAMKASGKDLLEIDTVTRLFEITKKYKEQTTYITASDIPMNLYEGLLPEDTIYYKFVFNNTETTLRFNHFRDKPYYALEKEFIEPIINKGFVTINDKKVTKLIIFVNNLSRIIKTINNYNLNTSGKAGVICGDNKENDKRLIDIQRIKNYYNLPTFTFVTSSGYQGIDLYDEETMNVIVSDASKVFTMMDEGTDLKQALSRQRSRDNSNDDIYIYIHNDSDLFDYDTKIKQIEEVREKIDLDLQLINIMESSSDERMQARLQEHLNKNKETAEFIYKIDGEWKINEKRFEILKYFIIQKTNEHSQTKRAIEPADYIEVATPVYRELTSYDYLYTKFKEDKNRKDFIPAQLQCENFNILSQTLSLFGRIYKNKNYAIERLEEKKKYAIDKPLYDSISSKFRVGNQYTRARVKTMIQQTYNDLAYVKKASFRDLKEFGIDYKEISIGTERGVEIIRKNKVSIKTGFTDKDIANNIREIFFSKKTYKLEFVKTTLDKIYKKYRVDRKPNIEDIQDYGFEFIYITNGIKITRKSQK